MLSGVIVKIPDGDENLYVCYNYEEKEKSWFVLERVKFNDDRGCSRFLYYASILFSKKEDCGMFCYSSRAGMRYIKGYQVL
jgi:hypothetical protein